MVTFICTSAMVEIPRVKHGVGTHSIGSIGIPVNRRILDH